jgi:uncharacterized membrane protein YfcA
MVGLGGGFVLVPMLRLFFGLAPAEAAGTSLALVVANSASGAFAYLLQKRVAVKVGLLIALGAFPGSILGAWLVTLLSARAFDWILAGLLVAVAVDTIRNRAKRLEGHSDRDVASIKGMSHRLAIALGFFVGVVSSLFGVGGGIVVVPALLYFSELPAQAIAATSQFSIFLTSPVGLAAHIFQHDIRVPDVVPLVLGGLCGGPIGAQLSLRLRSSRLLVLMGIALLVTAALLVVRHLLP